MEYKDTLNLPVTDFAMKANLNQREPVMLAKWEEQNLYGQMEQAGTGKPLYVLHDGPPYANGHIHIGHALNKILKDFVLKVKRMQGFHAPYVPGWDCHGLPIELQVEKNLGSKKGQVSKLEMRKLCREYAAKFVAIQKEEFKRLGIQGDWENPYLTMNYEYEGLTAAELAKFAHNNGLYRGRKPVHWCSSCVTALAEAEVEYADHTSPSIYVRFALQTADGALNESSNILTRMRELAVQSASETLNDTTDRTYIGNEFTQLQSELDRIAGGTTFNTKALLSSAATFNIQVGSGTTANDQITITTGDATATGLGVNASAVDTAANAKTAIDSIDAALDSVNSLRSNLGSYQNRLTSTINNLQVAMENTSAAQSRIQDVDVASETANMTRANILSQAGVAILAQANQAPQAALKLLQ